MTDKEIKALLDAMSKAKEGINQHQLNAIMNQGHRN